MTRKNTYKKKLLAIALALVMLTIVQGSDQQSSLTDEEKQLADLLNQHREQNGLTAVPVTNSLTKVARAHIEDLNTYHPDTATFGTGNCNRHSWSSHGIWTAVCYTGSAQASQMWNKPREITESYEGSGYEIAHWNSLEATPSGTMDEWMGSPLHNETILQQGTFAATVWKAMGVGIDGNYAVVWFGADVDPAGLVPATVLVTTDYPDPVAAYGGLTLSAINPEYAPGETVEFKLRKWTPGSANLEGAYYVIEKEVDGTWVHYFRVHAERWYFKTPVIEFGGMAKGIEWDQRQRGEPENVATRGKYRMKFYAPEAFDGFTTAEFMIR